MSRPRCGMHRGPVDPPAAVRLRGVAVGGYVRHHDPFVYFTEIRDTILRLHIHPLTSFESSLANPPSLTVVGLSNTHNMHNGSVAVADAYARRYVGAVLASAAFRD